MEGLPPYRARGPRAGLRTCPGRHPTCCAAPHRQAARRVTAPLGPTPASERPTDRHICVAPRAPLRVAAPPGPHPGRAPGQSQLSVPPCLERESLRVRGVVLAETPPSCQHSRSVFCVRLLIKSAAKHAERCEDLCEIAHNGVRRSRPPPFSAAKTTGRGPRRAHGWRWASLRGRGPQQVPCGQQASFRRLPRSTRA